MDSQRTEEAPNAHVDLDAPRPQPACVAPESGYQPMKAYDLATGQFVGWLGTHDNSVSLVDSVDEAAYLHWEPSGSDKFLGKETTPNDRYLGLGSSGWACWGLSGGWVDAVVYGADKTIALKSAPERKLYGPNRYLGRDYLKWSDGEDNQNILRFELD